MNYCFLLLVLAVWTPASTGNYSHRHDSENLIKGFIRRMAENVDSDESGTISLSELQDRFNSYDINGDRRITLEEFQAHSTVLLDELTNRPLPHRAVRVFHRLIFRRFDSNGDSFLTQSEMSPNIQRIDENDDGTISVDEFYNFLLRTIRRNGRS